MKELFKKVRKLEIKTRMMVDSTFSGEYHSAFKGQGLEFDEVRLYQFGDDIRKIDWNVTARTDQVYVKLFREEREQTMFVLFDISGSEDFGPEEQNKLMIGTEITAILAFSALKNNDKVGLATFTDEIEKFYSPRKGRKHVLTLLKGLLLHKANSKQTDIRPALDFARKILKRKSIVFVISDFIDAAYQQALARLANRHEVILIRLFHPNEILEHSGGILPVRDTESGNIRWINSGNFGYRKQLRENFEKLENDLKSLCARKRIGLINIDTSKDYFSELERFFKKRIKKNSRVGRR